MARGTLGLAAVEAAARLGMAGHEGSYGSNAEVNAQGFVSAGQDRDKLKVIGPVQGPKIEREMCPSQRQGQGRGQGQSRIETHDEHQDALEARFAQEPRELLLSRFLVACEGDADVAGRALARDVHWRHRIGLDDLLTKDPAQILGCDPSLVAHKVLCREAGVDRAGRTVVYYLGRAFDAQKLMELTTPQQFLLYHIWVRETAVRRAAATTRERSSGDAGQASPPYYTCVMDLKGCKLAQANTTFYSLLQLVLEVDQNHFPGVVGQVVIVNAPFFFTVVWKVIRKYITPEMEQKVTIISADKSKIFAGLSAFISREEIPADYGGEAPKVDWSSPEANLLCCFKESYQQVPVEPVSPTLAPTPEEDNHTHNVRRQDAPNQERHVGGFTTPIPSGPIEEHAELQSDQGGHGVITNTEISRGHADSENTGSHHDRDLSTWLPPHIAALVYDRSEPARPGLREDLLQAIEGILAEKDSFEQYALNERLRLRRQLKELYLLNQSSQRQRQLSLNSNSMRHLQVSPRAQQQQQCQDPVNLRVVKAGLRERVSSLQAQVQAAREECEANARAVKFARNYLEQETSRREQARAEAERTVTKLRKEVTALHEIAAASLPPMEMKEVSNLIRVRLGSSAQ